MTTTNAHKLAQEIKVSARVHALKRLAKDTSQAYEQMLRDSGMPREHFRLRLMLFSRLPPPREGA
jgi:hypothetical protein